MGAKLKRRRVVLPLLVGVAALFALTAAGAPQNDEVALKLSLNGGQDFGKAINILLLMTALSLAPAAVMLMTSFTRIVIVLSFLRQALSVQNVPSTRLLASIALFMTIFIMQPVWSEAYSNAVKPYNEKKDHPAGGDGAGN